MIKKYIKYSGQTVLDFVTTVYGGLSNLFPFLKTMGYSNYNSFSNDPKTILSLDVPTNNTNRFFYDKNVVINTQSSTILQSDLVCSSNLEPKTIVFSASAGDFNIDFNDDFYNENVTVVGYGGMNLYMNFSVKNNGTKTATASGTVSIVGIDSKAYSFDVLPKQIVSTSIMFENVPDGSYTVEITGICVKTMNIKVLPNMTYPN